MPRPSPPIARKTAELRLLEMGAKLRERRRELALSQAATAEAAGISRPTLSKIERGSPSVTVASYVAIALVLGLEILLDDPAARPHGADDELPATLELARYPILRQVAWHIPGASSLAPEEAFALLERGWRHVDADALSDEERALVDKLSARFGSGHDFV